MDARATNVALHEFGHSLRAEEAQAGAWLGENLSRKWEEDDAEAYVKQAHDNFQERQAAKRKGPRLTMRQLLEQRQSQVNHE